MHHLPAERLAALADEVPNTEEREHLAACAACSRERDGYLRLRELVSHESTRLAPPLTDWGAIASGLRREGILAPAPLAITDELPVAADAGDGAITDLTRHRTRRVAGAWWTRAAAAVLLVAGGVAGGRISAGASPLGGGLLARAALDTVTVVVGDTLPVFHNAREALAHLTSAEKQYQYAAEFLGQLDATGAPAAAPQGDSSVMYQTRLAALDNVMAATRQALYQAPHDPVINRYYLATVASREATLQQLNTALPAGARLTRF